MTAFTPEATAANRYADSDRLEERRPSGILVQEEAPPEKPRTFRFPQTVIPLDDGGTLLRLHEAPLLAVNTRTMEFDVQGWGITMPCAKVEDLPRQIARRFLTLFSKADQDAITPKERVEWLKILDKVDATQFSINRSAPHYVEGTLQKKNPLTIEWHDGTIEHPPQSLASAFFPLDPGDQFSAFVKLGRDNRTVTVERVQILAPEAPQKR